MEYLNIKILDPRLGSEFPLPSYETAGSAAMDLRALLDGDKLVLEPRETCLVGTGLAIHIGDPNYCGLILPRSGLGHKHGLILGNSVGLIDSDYQGELKISLFNWGRAAFTINNGDRVAQLLISPVLRPKLRLVEDFERSQRAEGGFGHTGVK